MVPHEERFTGRKHGKPVRSDNAHHLPTHAIAFCLRQGRVCCRYHCSAWDRDVTGRNVYQNVAIEEYWPMYLDDFLQTGVFQW